MNDKQGFTDKGMVHMVAGGVDRLFGWLLVEVDFTLAK